MPIQSRTQPTKIPASHWLSPGKSLRGLLEGESVNTSITLIRYLTDAVGEGPTLHVHPYDEIFTRAFHDCVDAEKQSKEV